MESQTRSSKRAFWELQIGGCKETLRQPYANFSPTLRQPFLSTPLQALPSVGLNSITSSESPSLEPLLKKRRPPAVLREREFRIHALEASNALYYRVPGVLSCTLEGIPGKALRAFLGLSDFFWNILRKAPAVFRGKKVCTTPVAPLLCWSVVRPRGHSATTAMVYTFFLGNKGKGYTP